MSGERLRLRLPKSARILRRIDFERVYAMRMSKRVGPLHVFAAPNGLEFSRLGMSASRRVGGAVARNGIRRRIREAFRLHRGEWPPGYDFIVNVSRHDTLKTHDYAAMIEDAINNLVRRLSARDNQR